jgi:hypothetical protein
MALKTNSKAAKLNIRNYIKEWSLDTLEERNDWSRKEGGKAWNLDKIENIAAAIMDIFRDEKPVSDEYAYRARMSEYDVFKEWASGLSMGGLFCYYYNREAVEDVKQILQETDSEAARFTESEAEELLTRLIYREVSTLATKADAPEIIPEPETETAGSLDTIRDRMIDGFNGIAAAATNTETAPEIVTA